MTQVQAKPAGHVQCGIRQRPLKLETTTREVTGLGGIAKLELGLGRQFITVFGDQFPGPIGLAPTHACRNQALRLRARGGMAAFDKKKIGTHGYRLPQRGGRT